VTSLCSVFLIYTFLEPLFVPVGSDVAMVFLYILALDGILVGMSLGVLLPLLLPGACFGATLSLFVGSFMAVSNELYFPVVGGATFLFFAIVAAK
jgi:callose synthase